MINPRNAGEIIPKNKLGMTNKFSLHFLADFFCFPNCFCGLDFPKILFLQFINCGPKSSFQNIIPRNAGEIFTTNFI